MVKIKDLEKQKLGLSSLVLMGLVPLLSVWQDATVGTIALIGAIVLAGMSLKKEKSWLAQSTITIGVLYLGSYLAYLVLRARLEAAMAGLAFPGLT